MKIRIKFFDEKLENNVFEKIGAPDGMSGTLPKPFFAHLALFPCSNRLENEKFAP